MKVVGGIFLPASARVCGERWSDPGPPPVIPPPAPGSCESCERSPGQCRVPRLPGWRTSHIPCTDLLNDLLGSFPRWRAWVRPRDENWLVAATPGRAILMWQLWPSIIWNTGDRIGPGLQATWPPPDRSLDCNGWERWTWNNKLKLENHISLPPAIREMRRESWPGCCGHWLGHNVALRRYLFVFASLRIISLIKLSRVKHDPRLSHLRPGADVNNIITPRHEVTCRDEAAMLLEANETKFSTLWQCNW